MGSPYATSKFSRVVMVRSQAGFCRMANELLRASCAWKKTVHFVTPADVASYIKDGDDPLCWVLMELFEAYVSAHVNGQEQAVFVDSRYEWSGFDRFNRAVVFNTRNAVLPKGSIAALEAYFVDKDLVYSALEAGISEGS